MPLKPWTDDAGPVLKVRRIPIDNNLDMTPMIDVTFLLLIFFLVSSNPDVRAALELPPAESGIGVSAKQSLVISVAQANESSVEVYLGDGKVGPPLTDAPTMQEAKIHAAVEEAQARGVTDVLLKAERRVHYRHVARLVRAASLPGVHVNLAVMEMR